MKRSFTAVIAFIICLACLVSAFAENFSALPPLPEKEHPDGTEMKVYFRSKLSGRAYLINEEAYLSLRDFAALYGMEIEITVDDTGFTALSDLLDITAGKDEYYMTANYRYLYLPDGYFACGDDVYLPLEALNRLFGVEGTHDLTRVDIDTKQCRPITGYENYYKLNMPADFQYWLPRIIDIETKDEPLAGQIAVGNVVLNRVKSDNYPDTIYKVLFDNYTGVQFAPAVTGSILYMDDVTCWLAVCLCWEGYNNVGDCLYFANPENNGNYWFRTYREYVKTIGRHEFYR